MASTDDEPSEHNESLALDAASHQRFLTTGDEAGSAPEDRAFRPDVEGLRAIAVLLVVLFHVGIPQMRGGFVGVDVFFVISGFVITGLLLREQHATNRTSFLAFYARRARRILPAAILVIVVSLVAIDLLVSHGDAILVASDGRWTALFLGNFHFSNVFPTLLAPRPASPLQHFWSLAIEEQFYLVYPALFVTLLAFQGRLAPRTRLFVGLCSVTIVSFIASVATTTSVQFTAYYSPFTRAWELAVGCLLAVGAPKLKRIPTGVAAAMTWAGIVGIIISAATFSVLTPFPGYRAALPVGSAALVIAGGTAVPRWGAETLLHLTPFRWIGRFSYSWYLWHWPILVIAAEHDHTSVLATSIAKNLALVVLALAIAAATYFLVENPIRHARLLLRIPWASIVGAAFIVASCTAFTFAF